MTAQEWRKCACGHNFPRTVGSSFDKCDYCRARDKKTWKTGNKANRDLALVGKHYGNREKKRYGIGGATL